MRSIFMFDSKRSNAQPMPSLEEMLQSLLLIEEGEHEFVDEAGGIGGIEEAQDIRQFFFPVTRHCIYLNHASNGPLPRPVARSLHEYIDDYSAYASLHAERWRMYGQGAHRRMANMIGARPEQIAFTASTGDSMMMIAQGLPWQEGDSVITAEGEFPSNVYPWLNLREQGVQVHLIAPRNSRIEPEAIFERIDEDGGHTRLVSLSLVEFSTGYRNDIAAIARYCHERGILCGIDAMQALGALEIDVQALGVDYLAAAAHKWLLGPLTTGILYVSDELLSRLRLPRRSWFSVAEPFDFFNYEQPLKEGAARFEHSTPNGTAIIGLDASLGVFESLDGGMAAVEARILGLTEHAIAGLERLGYPVVSPRGLGERSGIVCFMPHPQRTDMTSQQLVDELVARNIVAAARGTIARISPHFYNTIEEMDVLLNALEELKNTGQTTIP
jgi:cysteine desulfurase / selenocysteine lyase